MRPEDRVRMCDFCGQSGRERFVVTNRFGEKALTCRECTEAQRCCGETNKDEQKREPEELPAGGEDQPAEHEFQADARRLADLS